MTYVYLITAIILEVIGTSALQASEQFTRPKPLILTALGYAVEWHAYPMPHSVCAEEIHGLANWMQARFSPAAE